MEVTHDGDTGGDGGAVAAPEQGGAGGFDPAPILEHVDKLGQSIESRLGEFEQRLPQQEDPYARNDLGQFAGQPDQQAGQPFAQQPGVPAQQGQPGMYDEYGELTPEAAQQQLQAMINPMMAPLQQQLQQTQAQLQQQQAMIQEFEMDRGAEQLEQKYPELKEPEKANALVAAAADWAQQQGQPELVARAGFLELFHKAQLADAAAANETAATPGPSLEPAGGASLAGAEDNPQQRIKAAGGGNSIWGI